MPRYTGLYNRHTCSSIIRRKYRPFMVYVDFATLNFATHDFATLFSETLISPQGYIDLATLFFATPSFKF